MEAVNDDRTILTKSLVTTDINDYPNDDSFKASKKLCEMVQSEVAGIFGPTKYLLLIITDLLLLVNFVFNCHHCKGSSRKYVGKILAIFHHLPNPD